MKKVYLKPTTEKVAYLHESNLMVHSDVYIGAKGINFEDEETEEDADWSSRNLWDE
ncbi:MAG: hypothetical protein K6C10_02260 [Prevotella sp.]|nr:hypothetical protein [Prevotella sp.]